MLVGVLRRVRAPDFDAVFRGPFQPIGAEELLGMRRADAAVAARQVVSGAIPVTPPTNALGVLGVERKASHLLDA